MHRAVIVKTISKHLQQAIFHFYKEVVFSKVMDSVQGYKLGFVHAEVQYDIAIQDLTRGVELGCSEGQEPIVHKWLSQVVL